MKKVAIKYCGGCNPHFDRALLTVQLLTEFPELAPVGADAPDAWMAVVVCGCSRCCAEHGYVRGDAGKAVICREEEFNALRERISQLLAE